MKIFIADDDDNIRLLIKTFLEKENYIVSDFNNGEDLLNEFNKSKADLVILDINMPKLDGLSLCSIIRNKHSVPIIIVSARDTEFDKISGITIGADDYLTKPFSPMELVARVKSLFRRIELSNKTDVININDVTINNDSKEFLINKELVNLTVLEFSLMYLLMSNKGKAVSKEEILKYVWNINTDEYKLIDDALKRLRKKLVNSSIKITAIRGYGFRLDGIDEA